MSDKSVPFVCPRCVAEGSYNGSLRHKQTDPVPICRNHGSVTVEMEPVREKK